MPGSFRDIDRGMRRISRNLRRGLRSVTVGIHSSEGVDPHQGSANTVAEVGTFHEFGAGVPERSYLRSTFDQNVQEYTRFTNRELGRSIDRRQPLDRMLGRVGLKAVSDVQTKIRSNIAPPLNSKTIRRKRSSTALIDTGQLINSITHKIK